MSQGLRFEVVPSWFKETLDKRLFKTPHEYAVETAKQKALEVAKRMPFVSEAFAYCYYYYNIITIFVC
jgi:predicted house-cleaning NTP pyrophosphatase (Maf/HAM1 superfamily)